AVARALVDEDLAPPDALVLPDHARGHGALVVEAAGLVEVEQPAQLVVLARGGGAGDGLVAQRVALGAELLDLTLGVDGVPDPADKVAHGLERPARPLLDRGDDLDDPP